MSKQKPTFTFNFHWRPELLVLELFKYVLFLRYFRSCRSTPPIDPRTEHCACGALAASVVLRQERARPTAWQTVFSRCVMCARAMNKRVICSAEVPQLRRLRRHQMCCTACTKGFQSHLQCVAAFTWSEAARRAPAREHMEARFTSCVCRREMSSARGTFGVICSGGGRPRPV